jgi:hypothetical protein
MMSGEREQPMDMPETDPPSDSTRKRVPEKRLSFATAELPAEKVETIRTSRMDARLGRLDKLLGPK